MAMADLARQPVPAPSEGGERLYSMERISIHLCGLCIGVLRRNGTTRVSICVCVERLHVHIYIYIHIYTHVHMYIHIERLCCTLTRE